MANSCYDLDVWKESMELLIKIYELVKFLPNYELYSLSDQMRRAAVSIPSNIAEGKSRNTAKEFSHFLSVARGSASELEIQLIICTRLKYLSEGQTSDALERCDKIERMLSNLMNKLA